MSTKADYNTWVRHIRDVRKKCEVMVSLEPSRLTDEELMAYLQEIRQISSAVAVHHSNVYKVAKDRSLL